jgi:hypothetical protein
VKNKTKLNLEINVLLPKEFLEQFPSIRKISREEAIDKHLGTMKYHYKSDDISNLETIMRQVLVSCEKEIR